MIKNSFISWPGDMHGSILITDIQGKQVAKKDASVAGEFSLSSLIPGVYLVMLVDENGIQWSRVVSWVGE